MAKQMSNECAKRDPAIAPKHKYWRVLWGLAATLVVALSLAVWFEVRYSGLQAHFFSAFAREVSWQMQSGANEELWLPQNGPYDSRLGYSLLNQLLPRLREAGYEVSAQVRQSDGFRKITSRGYYPIYREKTQAGLTLVDRSGKPIYESRYPQRQYANFDAVPQLVVDSLLYVENHDLLDSRYPKANPAVDWVRLTSAALSQTLHVFDVDVRRAGGSTLATQIEKFRHSPGGRTRHADDKLRQMISASLRVYQEGEETLAARQRIVVDYLNSVPLAGVAGYGEVNGLGDGLWAWYGRDFDEANRLLADENADADRRALAFKEALSLIVAQRRPSGFLLNASASLENLTDSYLRLMANDSVISGSLRDEALRARIAPARRVVGGEVVSFIQRKAINSVRATLGTLLGVDGLYSLDRLDLEARTTLDNEAQAKVTSYFDRLVQDDYLRCAGFKDKHLLAHGDPLGVSYSFTLYEKAPLGNLLRVQADNVNQPLDINAGTKLDLGSTAKLRTLLSYLEAIADLHGRYVELDAKALSALAVEPRDHLSVWAIGYLRGAKDRSLTPMLEAAMARTYSASPYETFFTGGGVHRFSNFREEEDTQLPSVAHALEQSINLSFIRIMRDVVHYQAYEAIDAPGRALREGDATARKEFLERFAEHEGLGFVRSFWHKHVGLAPTDRLELLADSVSPRASPLAAIFMTVHPDGDFATFSSFLRERIGAAESEARLRRLYDNHRTRHYDLSDQGYLAHVHPLELWLVAYLNAHPEATLRDVESESVEARRQAAHWLFAKRFKQAQNIRIATTVEDAAFERIASDWRRLGYPFEHLVPSLATAIGSSADRPAALAELIGILVNDGIRRPTVRIDQLRFAAATPYETLVERHAEPGDRVLAPEIARVARAALLRVVDSGTASRVRGSYRDTDDKPIAIGGKTGTGDHRFQTVNADGTIKNSRVVNRAATFAFYMGDRYYGVVTAFVPGAKAADYDFTSSLPVQILKDLQPALQPLVAGKEGGVERCAPGTRPLHANEVVAHSGRAGVEGARAEPLPVSVAAAPRNLGTAP
jgi:membrane peptidoglycan carboxypeptidase